MITVVDSTTLEYRGLEEDTKPVNQIDPQTGEIVGKVSNGSTFIEIDTGKKFMFDKKNNT